MTGSDVCPTLAGGIGNDLLASWPAYTTDWNLYFRASTDGGATWSGIQRADDDATGAASSRSIIAAKPAGPDPREPGHAADLRVVDLVRTRQCGCGGRRRRRRSRRHSTGPCGPDPARGPRRFARHRRRVVGDLTPADLDPPGRSCSTDGVAAGSGTRGANAPPSGFHHGRDQESCSTAQRTKTGALEDDHPEDDFPPGAGADPRARAYGREPGA